MWEPRQVNQLDQMYSTKIVKFITTAFKFVKLQNLIVKCCKRKNVSHIIDTAIGKAISLL